MPNLSQYLTITQAAARRGVTRPTIYAAIADGRLKPIASPHGQLIRVGELARLEKRKSPGRPKKAR